MSFKKQKKKNTEKGVADWKNKSNRKTLLVFFSFLERVFLLHLRGIHGFLELSLILQTSLSLSQSQVWDVFPPWFLFPFINTRNLDVPLCFPTSFVARGAMGVSEALSLSFSLFHVQLSPFLFSFMACSRSSNYRTSKLGSSTRKAHYRDKKKERRREWWDERDKRTLRRKSNSRVLTDPELPNCNYLLPPVGIRGIGSLQSNHWTTVM